MSAGYAVFAKHPEGKKKKEYVFRIPDALGPVFMGDVLLVDTKRGISVAVASSDGFFSPDIEAVAVRFPGVTLPLANVRQVAGKVLRAHIKVEAECSLLNTLSEAISKHASTCRELFCVPDEDGLPF